ncbi:uncharacterized protein LOC115230414 isoform X1 [Octopus sinensis]|uniref:Uncharacterized protein LOC115230414 isoform X1 n=1 Tax=Octopus sinensis TaxID=2607531 RepID=A0A6P7U660_9MOLL|nr:uncharacterized protein LOC115230414 isoform X1 [Octopus sinensis]
MSIRCLLLVGICLGIARHVYAVQLFMKPGETSDAAIDETIRQIRTECILAKDYSFLRRLAKAQMNSIASTTGGIWRVTSAQLKTVQNACNGILQTNCSKAKTELKVDVSTLTMSDLQKPLYSGLVMSLFILNSVSPVPLQKAKQAQSWKTHINSNGDTTKFMNWSNELEKLKDCAGNQMDLVFVIDASGSVGTINFDLTKLFLDHVVSNLDISGTATRVAVIRYSSSPLLIFGLDKYSTEKAVKSAINAIPYNGGGTNTDTALDLARTSVFTNTRKSVAAKVVVLVTDGKSRSETRTVAAAQKLKDDGVTIFTIGVVNPRVSELTAAASEPSCTHFIHLKDYNEIDFIVKEIRSASCDGSVFVNDTTEITDNTLTNCNETKQQILNSTIVITSHSFTIITVSIQCGVATMYGSFNNSNPSLANYDYITYATDMSPGRMFVGKPIAPSTFFHTISSKMLCGFNTTVCYNAHYNITFTTIGVNDSCTTVTTQKVQYIFPYPGQPGKYIQYDTTGNLSAVCCPKNHIFDAILKRCKPRVSTTPGIALPPNPCIYNQALFYFPHPTTLSKFIQCSQWGQMYEMPCPSTLIWHPSIMNCLPLNPSVSVCGANTNGQFQPHPFSSSYFIACGAGTDYQLRMCENNKIWNQALIQCV